MDEAWSTACLDWQSRLISGSSLVPTLPLFTEEAERAIRIFKRLRLPDVIGNPTMAEACGPWFFPIVAAVFGSYDPETNRRMIQEFFLLIPKKNGKSSLAAAVMVVAMIVNRRPAAEFLLIAPTKQVADISFRQAWGIIKLDVELTKLFHPQEHLRKITHRNSGAVLQIKAADTDVITGSKSTGILVDETHVFAEKSKAADIFVEIRGALAARPDGFMIQITTQSKKPPAGVFKSELHAAREVRDGRLKLRMLPILYEFPPEIARTEAWKDPANWGLVNPNMDRSVDRAFLTDALTKAESEGLAQLALLASQHFNVEIGIGLSTDRWPGAEAWARQVDRDLTFETLLDRSEVIVAGIDGGGLDDLFGLVLIGRERETKRWLVWSRSWCHSGVLDRRKSIAQILLDAKKADELVIVDDELDDVSQIIEIIRQVQDSGLLGSVWVDPAGLGEFTDALAEIGVTVESKLLHGAAQGYGMMNALKTCERKLTNGTMAHAPSKLMDWCVGNIKIEPTATAIRATKQNAGDAKIDPAMAMFDAAQGMMLNPEGSGSVYSDTERRPHGLLIL